MCLSSAPQRSCTTERKIREESEQLRRRLKTDEANRLAARKEEETEKIRLIQMIVEMRRNTFLQIFVGKVCIHPPFSLTKSHVWFQGLRKETQMQT